MTAAEALGLSGPVDLEMCKAVLEGWVPDGTGWHLGRKDQDGGIHHRPGRDVTFSAPKSVSLAALVGGDVASSEAHDRAVKRTLAWVEKNIVETRCRTRRPAAWRGPTVHAHAPRMAGPCLRRRPGARFHRCAAAPGTVEPETGAASARSFRPRAAMTLRTVSNVGLRSPESAL